MPGDFRKALKERFILFDGATGTMLQRLGLKPGGLPDQLNLTNPELVKKVHMAYKDVGSDAVTTNTFGSTRPKLEEYNLEAKLEEINIAAAKTAREAAGRDGFVAGCVGPTGRFIEPVGDMTFDEAVEIFTEQTQALKKGGVDLILIETMMDIKELKAAVIAAKDTGLPVLATMTFDETMRSVLGTSPEVFAAVAEATGADCVGANCSLGIEGIYMAVKAMNKVTGLPLIAQANAGVPELKGEKTVFPAKPEDMVPYVTKLVSVGVRALGGCCGTTPEHIKAMGAEMRSMKPDMERARPASTVLASRTEFTLFGGGKRPIVVGERINPTGRKALSKEIKEGKTAIIRNEARTQAEAGAHVLDVNMGVPNIDEPASMTRAVFAVNENCQLPVVIDSADPEAICTGLKAADGKPLINSVTGEEKKLKAVLPLAKKYGAAVIGLTFDEKGIPETAEGRLKVAKKILKRALKLGIKKEDLVIDCLAMTISSSPESAVETLRAIRLIKEKLGLCTILGVSNISFGLPSRVTINSHFLSMAIAAGLDSAIINPTDETIMDAYHSSLVLINRDKRAESYINRFGKRVKEPIEEAKEILEEKPKEIRERLAQAVVEGDEENIVPLVEEAIGEGLDPIQISNEGLIPGLDEVGRLFACNRYYLPQVILSAETMKKGFNRIKRELKGRKGPSLGKVLLATVEGDIHDIGKNIVSTLLENYGFEVIDLGKNVPTEKVAEEAKKQNVDIVGLSALMTTTVMEMENVIKKLKASGVKAKTIVGGAVVTPEFAKRIGADECGGEATEAVDKIKRLLKTP
jgi:5-methyltetrahydrofolate--homocysteine methyltransferase